MPPKYGKGRPLCAALTFLAVLGALHGVYHVERRAVDRFLDRPLNRLVTAAAQVVGRALWPPVGDPGRQAPPHLEATASVVRGGGNGVEAFFLLIAGVAAVPAPARLRMIALAVCLAALFALNLLRVAGLAYLMAHHPQHSGFFHDQVAPGVLVLFALLLWLGYLGHLQRRGMTWT